MKEEMKVINECCFAYKNEYIDYSQVFTLEVLKEQIDSAIDNGATYFIVQMNEGVIDTSNNLHVRPAHLHFLFGKYDASKLEYKKKLLQNEIAEIDKILNMQK